MRLRFRFQREGVRAVEPDGKALDLGFTKRVYGELSL